MNSQAQKFASLARFCCREFSKSAVRNEDAVAAKSARLRAIQKQMGVDDNIPVYIKKGFGDKAVYQMTLLLTAAGLGLSFQTMYILAVGKKD